jgi:hypothetical protein
MMCFITKKVWVGGQVSFFKKLLSGLEILLLPTFPFQHWVVPGLAPEYKKIMPPVHIPSFDLLVALLFAQLCLYSSWCN